MFKRLIVALALVNASSSASAYSEDLANNCKFIKREMASALNDVQSTLVYCRNSSCDKRLLKLNIMTVERMSKVFEGCVKKGEISADAMESYSKTLEKAEQYL